MILAAFVHFKGLRTAIEEDTQMKLDLHGMRTKDAIDRFISEYNKAVRLGVDRLEVVHGYGSSGVGGDIKDALTALLDAYPGKVRYIKGEMLGNRGVTVVVPDIPLPPRKMAIDDVILNMLSKPSSLKDIEEGLCGFAGGDEIHGAMKALMRSGKATEVLRGGMISYTKK